MQEREKKEKSNATSKMNQISKINQD